MNPLSSLKRLFGRGDDADDPATPGDADGDEASRPRELAAEFVDAHPDADLDYTPESLLALDDVAAAVDAERDAALARAERDDERKEAVGADGEADADVEALDESIRRMGAYLGETFVRAYDGEWTFDESAGWVVELPATHRGQPLVLTVPSVLGDVFDGESSFAVVHDVFASELDVDTPELADEDPFEDETDPREEPAPADVVAAFDRLGAELAAEHDALDFSPGSLGALDDVARRDRERDDVAFDPDVDDLDLSVRGRTDAIAGYFGGVVRTHHTAEYRGELAEALVVEGATRQATLEPRAIAAAAAADETSFESLYANLSEDLGLGTAANG
ncbi:hypothetical protein [Halorubellus sp. PRR65]|uniref:hypothetical protein n=1 Tax=Halorubellus sp. PRR65 TaxID=3098148 RepID=UPI002B26032D|nr:hypothetical protein [Halorubellus sp. PRR65]